MNCEMIRADPVDDFASELVPCQRVAVWVCDGIACCSACLPECEDYERIELMSNDEVERLMKVLARIQSICTHDATTRGYCDHCGVDMEAAFR